MAFNFNYKSEEEIYLERIKGEYSKVKASHRTFTDRVKEIIHRNIDRAKIPVVSIEHRTKSSDSYLKKALDSRKSYTNPIKQITDISGVRVICYYNTDVQRIAKLIEREFAIDEENSIDKSHALGINSFGYRSVHQVIQLNEARAKLGEYAPFANMKAEIQIRTICQHAWASIEHSLNYKSEEEMDKEIARRLYRISGLLEVADDEFLFVKKKIEKIRHDYKTDFEKDEVDIDITADALDVYLKTIKRTDKIFLTAEKHNFHIAPVHPHAKNPIYNLSQTLLIAGISNISELEEIIEKPGTQFSAFLKLVFRHWNTRDKPSKITVDKYGLLRIAVISRLPTKKKQMEIMNRIQFGPELHRSVVDTIQSVRPTAVLKK